MLISIIIPAHNEEDNIAGLLSQVEAALSDLPHELVVVDDHCHDKTAQLAREFFQGRFNMKLVSNTMGKGFANAVKTGFASASGDVLIPVMADLCDDLSTVKDMAAGIDKGYDIVSASRYMKGGKRLGGSRAKGFLSRFAGLSLYYILGIDTHDIANAFKAYRRTVIEKMEIESKGFEISMEIPLKAHRLGFKITEVPTAWRERTKGKSSFKVIKLLPDYLKLYFKALF